MSSLTVCIPYAPHHSAIHHEAVASVKAQTMPCELVVYYDDEMRGSGYARNRALAAVHTDWVAFLDADDTIDPRFAEIGLGILSQYHAEKDDPRYVYTDWIGASNATHIAPEPCDVWTNQTFHLVTTILPTAAVRRIGGFDEQMQGVEDADFYVRLRLSGVCGIHVNAPLVSYREGGQRSITARASGQEASALQYMAKRYGGLSLMGCCGDNQQHPNLPGNEPQNGDILAQALWGGNRQQMGLATGRLYPRTAAPKLLYVAEADVIAAPHHWKRVNAPIEASNGVVLMPQYQSSGVNDWQKQAEFMFGGGAQAQSQPPAQSTMVEYKPNTPGMKKADVLAKGKSK